MFSLLLDIMLSRSHIKIPSVSNGMGNLKHGFSFVKKKSKNPAAAEESVLLPPPFEKKIIFVRHSEKKINPSETMIIESNINR